MPGSPGLQRTTKRRGLPKTKTGCLTCRRRRVKCGEERPRCLRCINLVNGSGDCEYPPGKTQSRQRKLLPRHSMSTKVVKTVLPDIAPTSEIGKSPIQGMTSNTALSKHPRNSSKWKPQELIPPPFRGHFKSQEAHRFHKFFCNEVADELAAFSPSNLWQQSILQAAESESFLRDAVIAIGVLYKITHKAPHMRPCDAHQLFKSDHAFAVYEYQKSLAGMRDAISSGSMDVRTALIACLLTVCLENVYGRKDLALLNCQSGAKMRRKFSVPLLSNGSSHQKSSGSGPSTSCMIEDELVAAFSHLDLSTMIFIDYYPADSHRIFKDELDDAIKGMPSRFNTMAEAIAYGK
ncbi:hypothetical protein B0O99DRAFT_738086 [Bisporella sp. PMI_857]|nr:hypothetical protein B0O99DRAFT_738086 [Bisporella sp. PMI_857]